MAIALSIQHNAINVMDQCDIWRDKQDVQISSDLGDYYIKEEIREVMYPWGKTINERFCHMNVNGFWSLFLTEIEKNTFTR